jgi:hypothetical protein
MNSNYPKFNILQLKLKVEHDITVNGINLTQYKPDLKPNLAQYGIVPT